jgi:hypothetical protein
VKCLEGTDLRADHEQDRLGMLERRHRPLVEPRTRVDHDGVVRLEEGRQDPFDVLGRDEIGQLGRHRRGEHMEAAVMAGGV